MMKKLLFLSEGRRNLFVFFSVLFVFLLSLISSRSISAQNTPEENRFSKVVLGDKLDEPMEMTLLKDGRVLFVERKGVLKQFDPNTGAIKTIATIPVNTKYTNAKGQKREAEEKARANKPQF